MKPIKALILIMVVFVLLCSNIKAITNNNIVYDKNDPHLIINEQAIEVNHLNDNFIIKSEIPIVIANWTSENPLVVAVSGDKEQASIKGLKEGYTKVRLRITLLNGFQYTHTIAISVYTRTASLNTYIEDISNLRKGANNVYYNHELLNEKSRYQIVGQCGDYYYIELIDNDKLASQTLTNHAFILKKQVLIPVNDFYYSSEYLSLTLNQSADIKIIYLPLINNFNNSISFTIKDNKNISLINNNNNNKVSIKGLTTGYYQINGHLKLFEDKLLSKELKISIYEARSQNDWPIASLNKKAPLYMGAFQNSPIISNGLKDQKFNIIGQCLNFYYLKLPSDYPLINGFKSSYAYILKKDLFIPFNKLDLNINSLIIRVNNKYQVKLKKTYPNIANESKVTTNHWSVKDSYIATVDKNGIVHGKHGGMTTLILKMGSTSKSVNVLVFNKEESTSGIINSKNLNNKYFFNFSNTAKNFHRDRYRLNNTLKNKLITNTMKNDGVSKKQALSYVNISLGMHLNNQGNWVTEPWQGSCFGMASVIALNYKKQININKYLKRNTKYGYTLNNIGLPIKNSKLEDIINYYHGSQIHIRYFSGKNKFYYYNDKNLYKNGLSTLVNNAKKYQLQELGIAICVDIKCTNTKGHEILVKKYYGKSRDGSFMLSIYDPSYPNNKGYVYVNKLFNKLSVSKYGVIRDIEILTDFNAFKYADID